MCHGTILFSGAGFTRIFQHVLPDKAGVVDMNKCRHEELTIKSVHDTPMTRNCIPKVLKEYHNYALVLSTKYLRNSQLVSK